MSVTTPQSEHDLAREVILLAVKAGWRHHETLSERRRHRGFPHLIFLRVRKDGRGGMTGRVLAVNVRGAGSRRSMEAQAWLDDLAISGVETYVWERDDLRTGEVERVLR